MLDQLAGVQLPFAGGVVRFQPFEDMDVITVSSHKYNEDRLEPLFTGPPPTQCLRLSLLFATSERLNSVLLSLSLCLLPAVPLQPQFVSKCVFVFALLSLLTSLF